MTATLDLAVLVQKDTMTHAECAAYLRICEKTLTRYCDRGLPYYQIGPRSPRFYSRDLVDEWFKSQIHLQTQKRTGSPSGDKPAGVPPREF